MNPTTHATEGNASAPVLYMALELSNRSWRLAFGDGAKHRQVSVPAADLAALAGAVTKAKERFKMPASVRVVSCYEAGRDGFWLHRHLVSIGIANQVVDAASIEVAGDANRFARRIGLAHVPRHDFVHSREVRKVCEVHRHAHCTIQPAPSRCGDRGKVPEYTIDLILNPLGELHRRRVEADLPGEVNGVARAHCL